MSMAPAAFIHSAWGQCRFSASPFYAKKIPSPKLSPIAFPSGKATGGLTVKNLLSVVTTLLFASVLCACSGIERLNDIVLNPDTATQEKARRQYEQSVADYRECLAANPANACDGQRQVMEADERVLSAAVLGLKAE
jgi:hypothetical protein